MFAVNDRIFCFHVKSGTFAVGYWSFIRDFLSLAAAITAAYKETGVYSVLPAIPLPLFFFYVSYKMVRGTHNANADDLKWWMIKTTVQIWFLFAIAFGFCVYVASDYEKSTADAIKLISYSVVCVIYGIVETWLLYIVSRCAIYFKAMGNTNEYNERLLAAV